MTGTVDPVLGRDIGFYLFQLPLYRLLAWPVIDGARARRRRRALTWAIRQGSQQVPPQLREWSSASSQQREPRVAGAAPVRAISSRGPVHHHCWATSSSWRA
jgi:hypothetical protein